MTFLARTRSGPGTLALVAVGALCALVPAASVTHGAAGPDVARVPLAGEPCAAGTTSTGPVTDSVLVVSVDGLNPHALTRLGRAGTPTLHRLLDEGASTLNARTAVELTVTLPNHTGMVTGRRIDAARGGHGVNWNVDRARPATVRRAAGERVDSVFTAVSRAGGSTALFASKSKFSLWRRSWGQDLDRVVIREDNQQLVRSLLRDLRTRDRDLRFVHLSAPDAAGHRHGFMGRDYLDAVRDVDRWLGRVVRAIDRDGAPAATLLLTSDHGGGRSTGHSQRNKPANYRVPFLVRGPGADAGADLYALNPAYQDPGRGRPGYAEERQPVRNGMVANVALDLLGLPPVPGSVLGADERLLLTAPTG
ncbi:alkaline phosphatase family protein [Nocardioides campestrisoli]|uniref:alkaline phosphatase family protein n=1 Tax=Nocardioides campestrisoli TaxID=2736757 RepID=UPI0015E7E388|nr:alkaline phosphatase family protein [Nocardioides campestrisoli]